MMTPKQMKILSILATGAFLAIPQASARETPEQLLDQAVTTTTADKPVKVYILSGLVRIRLAAMYVRPCVLTPIR